MNQIFGKCANGTSSEVLLNAARQQEISRFSVSQPFRCTTFSTSEPSRKFNTLNPSSAQPKIDSIPIPFNANKQILQFFFLITVFFRFNRFHWNCGMNEHSLTSHTHTHFYLHSEYGALFFHSYYECIWTIPNNFSLFAAAACVFICT